MRKHWLVFTLVLTFLAAAATVQAASVPNRLNGTTWRFTGFQLNQATDTPSVLYGRSLISDYNSTGAGASDKGGLNGTLNVFNSTSGSAGTSILFSSQLDNWEQNGTFFENGTDSPITLEFTNATSGLGFIYNPEQSLFISLGNETFPGSGETIANANGPQLGLMVQNLTIANNVTDVAGTWYFYGLKGADEYVKGILGSMTLTSTGTGTGAYYIASSNGTNSSVTSDTLSWNKTDNRQGITIAGALAGELVSVGHLSTDKNYMIGYQAANASAGEVTTLVAMKGAGTFSTSDFANKGIAYFSLVKGNATNDNPNATSAVLYFDSTSKVIAGNRTMTDGRTPVFDGTLIGSTMAVGSQTLAGVSHSTATLKGVTFLGRKLNNTYAGLELSSGSGMNGGVMGLRIMVPAASQATDPAPATAAEVTTLNDTTTFTVTGVGGATARIIQGNDVPQGSVNADLEWAAGVFTNSTDAEIKSDFGLSAGATIDRNFPTVNFATDLGAGNGYNMTVRKITFQGNNKLISEMPIPTKFYVNATVAADGTVNAANSTRQFTYRSAGQAITDGSWWITPSGAPTVTLDYNYATRLALNQGFDIWLAILDNGKYDLYSAPEIVVDPSSFVSGVGGGGGLGGGGDDAGCVLNPAAGFSVELLLLLLAPLAYFIRRRKK